MIRSGTKNADKVMSFAKAHAHIYDCRAGRALNSIVVLDNGDVVLSHLGVIAAKNRLNQPAMLQDSLLGSVQDNECAFSEVIMPDTPVVFQGGSNIKATEEDDDDDIDIF